MKLVFASFALVMSMCTACGSSQTQDVADAATGDVADVPAADAHAPADAPAATACTEGTVDLPHTSAAHFAYGGMEAPDHWSMLSTDYAMCMGMNQTPIDLPTTAAAETAPITFQHYDTVPLILRNNGHTLQVSVRSGYGADDPSVTYAGTTYYLLQFHAHTTSEHTIGGRSYPMEVHFVHATRETPQRLLVVGVMFESGADNAVVGTMLANDPGADHERSRCATRVSLASLLPSNRSFYHYAPGSLTTPPCTEGLTWFVMSSPLTLGAAQADAFRTLFSGNNNRPIQPLNGRAVGYFTAR